MKPEVYKALVERLKKTVKKNDWRWFYTKDKINQTPVLYTLIENTPKIEIHCIPNCAREPERI